MHSADEQHLNIRWSVVVPAHNCAHFLADTLREVVAQLGDRADAEVIVVDDASTDDPQAVVRCVGGASVRYERNARQLGAIGTFNRGVSLAQGEFVHLLHGDDMVLPGFYRSVESALAGSPALSAICRTVDVDDSGATLHQSRRYREGTGIWPDALAAMVLSNRVRAPGIVVRRCAYAEHGVFRADLPHAADWELWTRMAAAGPVMFVDEILACYRRHGESDTAHRMRTGVNIRERVTAIGVVGEHVRPHRRAATARRALLYSFLYAGRCALQQARRRRWSVAAVQVREGVRCLLLIPGGTPTAGSES